MGKDTNPNPNASVTRSIPKTLTSIAKTEGTWLNEKLSKKTKYATIAKAPTQSAAMRRIFILKASLIFPLKVNSPLS